MKKRFLSIFLSALITGSCISVVHASAEEINTDAYDDLEYIEQVQENNIAIYYDKNGKEVDITKLNNDIDVNENLLAPRYDLRDYKRSTPVKNQGYQGLCWDFAATASIESNILSQPELSAKAGENPSQNLDISEGGNSWYIHTNTDDETSVLYNDYIKDSSKGTNGGFPLYTACGLSSGYGTYPESLMPYEQYDSGYSEDLRFYSDYRLKDYSELTNDTDIIKTKIVENGAVAIHYNCYSSNTNMVDGMQAYYDNGNPIEIMDDQSHVVAIVGWDDSFSRDNFNPLMQPENDGAWLCKNSWGTENCSTAEGYEGYFWMSYETAAYSVSQFIMQSADEYDNIYQLQATAGNSISVDSASNIFTAKNDEQLKQISFYTNGASEVTVEIYKLNKDYTSPVDGNLLSSFDAETDFTGIHNFDCPNGINLTQGDTFSVVLKCQSQLQLKYKEDSYDEAEGLSYYYIDGEGWFDVSNDYNVGYLSIKAYTSNSNGADKTRLEELIKISQEIEPDSDIDSEVIENLNSQTASAQKIADNISASQNEVDNAYYLLKNSLSKVTNYSFTVSSVEDYYQLCNEIENKKNNNIKKIIINADLDFNGESIEPIFSKTAFTGIFDGNGNTMSNFTINAEDSMSAGLFGSLSNAVIKNITFSNCKISANENATLISTRSNNSLITNCTVKNSIIKSRTTASGLLLYAEGDEIRDCNITNTKIYGNYGANLFFENYSATTCKLNNCETSGNELYSFILVTDNTNSSIKAYCKNEDYFYQPIIKLDDDSCTIDSFIGNIISADSQETNITTTDGKCSLENKNGEITVALLYEELADKSYIFSGDIETEELLIEEYSGGESNMVIPSEITGNPVVGFSPNFSISYGAQDTIKSITVPGTIANIPMDVFSSLLSLESVVLEEGVKNIEERAFSGCINLASITFPNSLVKIGEFAFASCSAIQDLQFGNGLEVIDSNAFSGCTSIVDPKLPDSLKEIGPYAFAYCAFKSITIGKNITEIGDNAFANTGKTALDWESVYIPDFVINGYSDTAAQQYAEEKGIEFVDVEKQTPIKTGELFDYGIFLKGDVNLDGNVNVLDSTLISKWIANSADLNPIQLSNALVCDSFDSIDITNATNIQKFAANLIDTLESSAAG